MAELVALMLMHRAAIGVDRAVAADVRCATVFQGEAAGRSMAVPVNWRVFVDLSMFWDSSELGSDDARPTRGTNTANMRESYPRGTHHEIMPVHHTIDKTLFSAVIVFNLTSYRLHNLNM